MEQILTYWQDRYQIPGEDMLYIQEFISRCRKAPKESGGVKSRFCTAIEEAHQTVQSGRAFKDYSVDEQRSQFLSLIEARWKELTKPKSVWVK